MDSALTPLAATVAAVVGLMNYYQSVSMSKDKIKVSLGTKSFEARPTKGLHVINQRPHSTVIVDWGFVDGKGFLHSMVVDVELGNINSQEVLTDGSTKMKDVADYFEFEVIELSFDGLVGAYAKTASSNKVFFEVNGSFGLIERIKYRFFVYKNILKRFFLGTLLYT